MPHHRIGVVLFQLGGPDGPEAIEPFLYNLFLDPDIIDFPLAKVSRPLLAKLISKGRSHKARTHYNHIGGSSPIRELTERQAEALQQALRETYNARVFVAMRYWHPLTDAAVLEAKAAGCEELVLLPLYPQYSSTTTGSAINEWTRQCRRLGFSPKTHLVREFFNYEPYLDSLVAQINSTLERFARPEEVHVLYSAHNVPRSVIEAGDPYQQQIEETAELVAGGAVFFHDLTLHASYPNTAQADRWTWIPLPRRQCGRSELRMGRRAIDCAGGKDGRVSASRRKPPTRRMRSS